MAIIHNDKELKRVLGVAGLSLNIINITVGAGIFALPAIVGVELGAFSIFAYVFCGFMMATIMLCYAEIGTRVTKTGGSYAYVLAAFGDFAGFIVNWLAVFGWSILGSGFTCRNFSYFLKSMDTRIILFCASCLYGVD